MTKQGTNPIAMLSRGFYTVISAAVATWAISELFLAWVFGIPQTPTVSAETHNWISLGMFTVFAVVIYWKVDFRSLGISSIRRVLSR